MKKNKCSICLKVKGKRLCAIKEKTFICPRCCAEIRNADCEGCSHYAQAEQYAQEQLEKSHDKTKTFTARIDPAVDDEVDKALSLVELGKTAPGETILNTLIEKHPDLYTVQYGMGTLQAMKGNYAESIVYFDNCLEIFPYLVEAWFNRGTSCRNLLDVDEALISFQKVVEFGDPQEDFVQTAKKFLDDTAASILKETGLSLEKYSESYDTFKKAFAAMKNGEYEKAIAGFTKVLRLNSNNVQANGNLGLCYALLGQRAKALDFLDRALKIDPTYEPAISNRAIVLSMKEGEKPSEIQSRTVEYYKDVIAQGK